ncbi:hypothetical protein K443DRAFT_62368, partial [Laccaria amethystina LaAM-08-1]
GLKATLANPRVSAEAKHEAQNRLKEMGYEIKDPEHEEFDSLESINQKNPERVAAGLKATVHNPAVSEEAKTRAREKLAEM